jgi:hypothetical protein
VNHAGDGEDEDDGTTALINSALQGHLAVTELLLGRGAAVG